MEKTLAEGQAKQAVITCLKLLAASPKSGAELKKKLVAKGYDAGIVDRTLEDLKAQGVLDDTAYARDLMARLKLGKAAGRHRIAFEFKRHGISKKISEGLLATLTSDQETERALEQARTKWAAWAAVEPRKRRKRLYDFLIRKGYDFQIAQDILQKLSKKPVDD